MSNQVFSNDTAKYPVDGSSVSIGGVALSSLVNQDVRTTANPSFTSVSALVVSGTTVSTPDIRSIGTINFGPGNVPTYQILPGPGSGLRLVERAFSGTTSGTGVLQIAFNALPSVPGTIEIQTQFYSTSGPSIGQYGSYKQITRYSAVSGTTIVGSNLELLQQRDAGLATASITLTGNVGSLVVGFVGVAGEQMTWTGVMKLYQ